MQTTRSVPSIKPAETIVTNNNLGPETLGPNNVSKRHHQESKVFKRKRVPISCAFCRKRKIKCDRKKPYCSSCVKTNTEEYCIYKKPAWAQETENRSLDINTAANSKTLVGSNVSAELPAFAAKSTAIQGNNKLTFLSSHAYSSSNIKADGDHGVTKNSYINQLPRIDHLLNTNGNRFMPLANNNSNQNNINNINYSSPVLTQGTQAHIMNENISRPTDSSNTQANFGQFNSVAMQHLISAQPTSAYSPSDRRDTSVYSRSGFSPFQSSDTSALTPYLRNTPTILTKANSANSVSSIASEKKYYPNGNNNQLNMHKNIGKIPLGPTLRNVGLESKDPLTLENPTTVPPFSEGDVSFEHGKSEITASSLSQEKPSAVEKEIQLLKDKLNRLQASLNITKLPDSKRKSFTGSDTSTEKDSKAPEKELLFSINYNDKDSSNSSAQTKYMNFGDKFNHNMSNGGNKGFINDGSTQSNNKSITPLGYNGTNLGSNYNVAQNHNENFLDSLMKSMQTGEFLNFLNNSNLENAMNKNFFNDSMNNFVFSYPNTMSRKFNSEEAESPIEFKSFLSPRGLNALDGFIFEAQDLQMTRYPSFMECWTLFPNDFYIRSLFASRALSFKKFIDQFKAKISENLDKDSIRFITSDEENEELIKTSLSLTGTFSKAQARCLRSCMLANNDAKKIVPEPINSAKASYLIFDLENKSFVNPFSKKYKGMMNDILKSLFLEVKSVLPNRKIAYLLIHTYFQGISNIFICLDKESTIRSITGNMDKVLFDDISFEEFLTVLIDDSLTLTFDTIGIVLCILKVAFDVLVDRITEHAYESKFDSNCLSSTEKLIFESKIDTTNYIHLAKRCFSYKFSIENVFHEFRKVHNGLKKVQLGLLIFGYQLSFEDRFHQASLLFNTSNEEHFNNVEEYFPQLKEAKETPYEKISRSDGSVASEQFKAVTNNDLLRIFSTSEACSIFSKCVSSSLTSFLHQLILFCKLLKLDRDPMGLSNIDLTSQLVSEESEIPNTIETIKLWKSVWLQMLGVDKGLAFVLGAEPLLDHDNEKISKKIKKGTSDNYDGGRAATDLMLFESLDDKVYTNAMRRRAKCVCHIVDPIIILNRKISNKFKYDTPVKLNDYLRVIKSIDNFIEFNNDYSFNEIFQFIDHFYNRYPIFFHDYQSLNEDEKTEYHNLELKSNIKCFEISNSLYFLVFSYGLMFNIYLNLFNNLDRVIGFQKSSPNSSTFKKVLMNTQEIINKVIKEVRKVIDISHYRKFMLGKFKTLFRKGVEPLLFVFINFQLSLQLRIGHTINLFIDSLKRYDGSTTSTEDIQIVNNYKERINLLEKFLRKVIESIKEMFRIFEAMNNMDREPDLNDLNDEQLNFYESVNRLKYKSTSWFSHEALLSVVCFSKIFDSLQFKNVEGIFESKKLDSTSDDLFNVHDIKLKSYATSNGASVILPNFCSLLFLEAHEIDYITNDILKIFPGTLDVGSILTPNEDQYVHGKFHTPLSPSDKSIFTGS